MVIAAGVSAIAQTGVDMIETSFRGEEVSLADSAENLVVNFVANYIGNNVAGKIVKTNNGWFQPRKFSSVFTKSYGKKLIAQDFIGTQISSTHNFIKNKIDEHIRFAERVKNDDNETAKLLLEM